MAVPGIKVVAPAFPADVIAASAAVSIGVGVGAYIVAHQRLRFPWQQEIHIYAEFDNAQAVTAGQGQTVRVSGVQIGEIGEVALRFGADDMGSIMIEENVVSAAGAHNEADEKMLRYLIREAGFRPQQRDILYRHVNREESVKQDASDSATLRELTVAFAD